MPLKVNNSFLASDALNVKLNEIQLQKDLSQFKIDNPKASEKELEEKETELKIKYNLK
jgi:hypothetical protein